MGVFIKYYGFDPIDISWSRFIGLLNVISQVEYLFVPKDAIQLGLEKAAEELEKWKKIKQEKEAMTLNGSRAG